MHCVVGCDCCLQDPFAEKTVYNDGPVDKLFIKLFTQKMADQLDGKQGWDVAATTQEPASNQLPGWQAGLMLQSLHAHLLPGCTSHISYAKQS